MQNNNSNDYIQKVEIDLKEIIKLLNNSKILIITITLVITILGSFFTNQKAPKYRSNALLEIGQFFDIQLNKEILIEPTNDLFQELKIQFIHKKITPGINYDNLSLNPVAGRLIKISILSPSSETSGKLLNELVEFIENRHSNLLRNKIQRSNHKIDQIDNQIKFQKTKDDEIKIQFNNQITDLDKKIELLNNNVKKELENLKLLQSDLELDTKTSDLVTTLHQIINSYETEIIENNNLKVNIAKLLASLDHSYNIFNLSQEKRALELELEFLQNQNPTKTQLVGKIETKEILIKQQNNIILSFIFGLSLSLVIVYIINFLKAFKRESSPTI